MMQLSMLYDTVTVPKLVAAQFRIRLVSLRF